MGDCVAAHFSLNRRDIQIKAFAQAAQGGHGNLAIEGHQRIVQLLVCVTARNLFGRHGKARGQHRLLTQDRKFFDDQLDIAISFQKLGHFAMGAFAIATAVIKEFD